MTKLRLPRLHKAKSVKEKNVSVGVVTTVAPVPFLAGDCLKIVRILGRYAGGSTAMPMSNLINNFGDKDRLNAVLQYLAGKGLISNDGEFVGWCGSWNCRDCVNLELKAGIFACNKNGMGMSLLVSPNRGKYCGNFTPKKLAGLSEGSD